MSFELTLGSAQRLGCKEEVETLYYIYMLHIYINIGWLLARHQTTQERKAFTKAALSRKENYSPDLPMDWQMGWWAPSLKKRWTGQYISAKEAVCHGFTPLSLSHQACCYWKWNSRWSQLSSLEKSNAGSVLVMGQWSSGPAPYFYQYSRVILTKHTA